MIDLAARIGYVRITAVGLAVLFLLWAGLCTRQWEGLGTGVAITIAAALTIGVVGHYDHHKELLDLEANHRQVLDVLDAAHRREVHNTNSSAERYRIAAYLAQGIDAAPADGNERQVGTNLGVQRSIHTLLEGPSYNPYDSINIPQLGELTRPTSQ